MNEASPALLSGLTIIEVSSFVAAPLAGLTLAQLGAKVIRVDPIGGGADRDRWPLAPSGTSLYWGGLNQRKRSITVDLRSQEGDELVAQLVASAGILLTNAPPTRHLEFESLVKRRPDVIVARVSGHRDGSSAVDYTVNAGSGFPAVTGPASANRPVNHVLPAWDVSTGLYAALALLAADRQRSISGRPQRIDIALADVALGITGNLGLLAEAQLASDGRPRIGNDFYGDFGRDFETADGGRVMITILTKRHWSDLIDATGLGFQIESMALELGADFSQPSERYRHRVIIAELLEPWFARSSVADVGRAFSSTSVLWSRYRTFAQVVREESAHNPMLSEIFARGIPTHRAAGSPVVVDGIQTSAARAPQYGEDTDIILRDVLGFDTERTRDLMKRGVVA